MIILSLFDGISCGQVAINRLGIKNYKYFASEIDKYAIQITQKNYPNTIQLGDIEKILYRKGKLYSENGDFDADGIDLLMGGSPCQGFSFVGKQLNFEDPRSALFFEFVRLLDRCKPKYFLLENVVMKKEYQDVISQFLGVEPIMINSALVSAQNRKRLYWTNIPNIEPLKDKNLKQQNIILNNINHEDECRKIEKSMLLAINNKKCKIIYYNDKFNTCTTKQRRWNNSGFIIDEIGLRYIHPIECERLQTLPDNYTEGISNTQRYKCIGNGWTVDAIAHILKNMKK